MKTKFYLNFSIGYFNLSKNLSLFLKIAKTKMQLEIEYFLNYDESQNDNLRKSILNWIEFISKI